MVRASGLSEIMALMSGLNRSMRAINELTMSRHVVAPEKREACSDEMEASRASKLRDCDVLKRMHAKITRGIALKTRIVVVGIE